jgi:hypothetical protein
MTKTKLTSFKQNFNFVRASLAALSLLTIHSFAASVYAAPVQMLLPAPTSMLAKAKVLHPAGAKTAAMPIAFNADALHSLAVGDEAALVLPNGQQYSVMTQNIVRYPDGNVGWVGYLQEYGKRYSVVATTGPAGTYGTIETPSDSWAILPGKGAGFDFLINGTREAAANPIKGDPDDAVLPFLAANTTAAHKRIISAISPKVFAENEVERTRSREAAQEFVRLNAAEPTAKAAPTPQRVIDVMVVVTDTMATARGATLETRIAQAFTATNNAYAASEVAITINKVGATVIREYGDSAPGKGQALADIVNNNGVFADIEALRASVGADLVVFLRNTNDGGVAYLGGVDNIGGAESWNSARFMYGVVGVCDFPTCDLIFAHELGHNMGLQHDRTNADATLPAGLRSYSYGWKINSGAAARDFRTIMSYAPPNNRVGVFSNPNLFICNPAGFSPADACGVANSEDNARVLNENRLMISSIKTATGAFVSPKIVLIANPNRFSAAATSATARVSRLGDVTQAVSVNYATANGTAIAGVDYTATSGTVSWAAGDGSVKTVSIPLLSTSASVDRAFTLSLSGATGPAGTSIVLPSQVTLTRATPGAWPPGNVLPAGWTQGSGANASWSVVSNDAQEGSYSLKSNTITDSQTASIEFTAAMGGGNITFYRKTSSEEGYDFFKVFVDGVEFTTAAQSGESDWTLVSIPVTGGTHTIRFSYSKDNGVASGSDSAWIDFLRLPKTTGDLSADGKSDIIFNNTSTGEIAAWLMNGPSVTSAALLLGPGAWTTTHSADLNGDGKADLLLRNNSDGTVVAWLMNGLGVTSGTTLLSAGSGWSISHTADFNGDGKADILLRHTDGRIVLWLMNGSTVSSGTSLLPAGTGYSAVHVADFNGDGKADILLRNTSDGTLVLWTMNGGAVTTGTTLLSPNSGYTPTHTGDFNGDGKADILLRNNANGSIVAWLMNGSTVTSGTTLIGASNWYVNQVADFNGDGKSDILLRNADGTIVAWLMNGSTVSSGSTLFGPTTAWAPTKTGDYNGDGKADIIMRNNDGTLVMWLMNGGVITSGSTILGAGFWNVGP